MRTLIALPCMDMVQTPFLSSILGLKVTGPTEFRIVQSTLVYNARNQLAKEAIDKGFDRLFFLDSDMTFQPDLMERLSARMDEGREFICGLCFTRKKPFIPTIYKRTEYEELDGGKGLLPVAEPYIDYPHDSVVEIASGGFGGCMISTDLVKRLADRYGLPFAPLLGFGEDLSFCIRARENGAKLYCDTSIKLGHVMQDIMTEDMWNARKG